MNSSIIYTDYYTEIPVLLPYAPNLSVNMNAIYSTSWWN